MTKDQADQIAIQALQYISVSPELMSRFFAVTGMEPQTLRKAASEPGFLAASLDFLRQNESDALAFAANNRLRPEDMERAAYFLSGEMEA